jgi:hypothetical protein
MVNLSRLVAEGALPGNDDQRARPCGLLGIGLYLSGRQGGAESVFADLVKLRPHTNLDPAPPAPRWSPSSATSSCPQPAPQAHGPGLLAPVRPVPEPDPVRGWILGGLEVATFAACPDHRLVLADWVESQQAVRRGGTDTQPLRQDEALNFASVGALTLTWVVGVVGRPGRHADPQPRPPPSPRRP